MKAFGLEEGLCLLLLLFFSSPHQSQRRKIMDISGKHGIKSDEQAKQLQFLPNARSHFLKMNLENKTAMEQT